MNTPTLTEAVLFYARYHPQTGLRALVELEMITDRASKEDILLPEVRGYIEANGARLLAPAEQVHLLADKLSANKRRVTK